MYSCLPAFCNKRSLSRRWPAATKAPAEVSTGDRDSAHGDDKGRATKVRFLYTAHPSVNRLRSVGPIGLWKARLNVLALDYKEVLSIRDAIWALVDHVTRSKPDFIPFFATGSIPYVFPLMQNLSDIQQEELLDGSRFHMFPGLLWGGRIDHMNSEEFFIHEAEPILHALASKREPIKILSIDTTNTGNAVNKAIKAVVAVSCPHPSIRQYVYGSVSRTMGGPG
jgi:hypothetical protein